MVDLVNRHRIDPGAYGQYIRWLRHKERKEMAKFYRALRRQDPRQARMVFRSVQAAAKCFDRDIWEHGSGGGGGLKWLIG